MHLPPELQQQVIAEVTQAKERSGMPIKESLKHLGISRGSYYRWKREQAWTRNNKEPTPPVQAYEALPEERQSVIEYALEHPEVRHRELAWRMIDEDVAYLSASTVYRILREESLMASPRGRRKRYREEMEKACAPDEIWGTDLMYLKIGERTYYLVNFIDEYSRYVVHWELLSRMDGHSVSLAAQRALERLPRNEQGELLRKPTIRSDNRSGFICGEFTGLLTHHGLTHHRIKPHCPEENGVVERYNRTMREGIEEHDLSGRYDSEAVIESLVDHYTTVRLHSSLEFQTPTTWYSGDPQSVRDCRQRKLTQARHRRKEINPNIQQKAFPL